MYFILGFIIYVLACSLSYIDKLKSSNYFVIIGILLGMFSNAFWFLIAKNTTENSKLYTYGMLWDGMIVLTYALIPILLFNVKPDAKQIIGACMVIIGMVVLKL